MGHVDPHPFAASHFPAMSPMILVVDDDPLNVEMLQAYLEKEGWHVVTATSGWEALSLIAAHPPDLVLLDVMMPGVDGFAVCRQLKSAPATRLIPVVMVTALTDVDDRVRGIEVGVDDFLSKPINWLELVTRVRSLLRSKSFIDELESAEHVITALAKAIEARDGYTEQHTERVASRAVALGERLGLAPSTLRVLHYGAMLHDAGKIGVPEAILSKPSRLTNQEFAIMRRHPIIGEEICAPLRSHLIAAALPIIRSHHERIDGRGYPDGLVGVQAPLIARIVAIADSFDAMTSNRPYRDGMTITQALTVLTEGAGTQWDRDLVGAFLQLSPTILHL